MARSATTPMQRAHSRIRGRSGTARHRIPGVEPMAFQARIAGRDADVRSNLIIFRSPVDLRREEDVDGVHEEILRAAAAGHISVQEDVTFPEQQIQPDQRGMYYFLWIRPDAGDWIPMLIPERDLRSFLLGVAARDSLTTALDFTWQDGLILSVQD